MSGQMALDLGADTGLSRGDHVSVPLAGRRSGKGRVVAVDSHTSPHAPYSPLIWVRVEGGPEWAVGEEWSWYANNLEAKNRDG